MAAEADLAKSFVTLEVAEALTTFY